MTYQPPPSYPPAYPPPPPPRPPRKSHRTLFIVLGVVGVLCIGGAVAGGFFVVRTFLGIGEPARDAASAFLDDLVAGDHEGAYSQLCQPAQARYSQADFDQEVAAFGQVTDYRITGFDVQVTNGAGSGTVTVRLTVDGRGEITHVLELIEEGDDWRVCGDPF